MDKLFSQIILTAVIITGANVCTAAPRIYNPGFEAPGQGWKHAPEYSVAEKVGVDNSKALYVKREKTDQSNGWAWQFIQVEGGKKYRVSCDIKANITQRGKYKVGAGFVLTLRETRKILKKFYPIGCYESTNGQWKTIQYTFTAPATANSCEIQIGLYGGFLGEAWFDNVKIEEVK